MTNFNKRRFPPVLSERLSFALSLIRKINSEGEDVLELLSLYRKGKGRITGQGIFFTSDNKQSKPDIDEWKSIPYRFFQDLKEIDEAFSELHDYRAGGIERYISKDVVDYVDNLNSKKPTGKLGVRTEAVKKIVEKMIEEGVFLPSQIKWPKTEIWIEAKDKFPKLFQDIKADMEEGGFHKAYTEVKGKYN
ncbi:MAG: hypothetical protein H8E09_00095 [Gammaproteobacteria bacterium]|nr:hypothetical protein [Gammaproteobacteria bacterium]MBL6999229.1 hypothetical protein [Gammaproteobacteria bacterium]